MFTFVFTETCVNIWNYVTCFASSWDEKWGGDINSYNLYLTFISMWNYRSHVLLLQRPAELFLGSSTGFFRWTQELLVYLLHFHSCVPYSDVYSEASMSLNVLCLSGQAHHETFLLGIFLSSSCQALLLLLVTWSLPPGIETWLCFLAPVGHQSQAGLPAEVGVSASIGL